MWRESRYLVSSLLELKLEMKLELELSISEFVYLNLYNIISLFVMIITKYIYIDIFINKYMYY